MIRYISDDVKIPNFPKRKISAWITQIAKNNEKRIGEVSFIFCSKNTMKKLNIKYLNHSYNTDVITFDYESNTKLSGDIFISIDDVRSNAIHFKVSFNHELFRVMIHGILHLCGFNDTTEQERNTMENIENDALSLLDKDYVIEVIKQ